MWHCSSVNRYHIPPQFSEQKWSYCLWYRVCSVVGLQCSTTRTEESTLFLGAVAALSSKVTCTRWFFDSGVTCGTLLTWFCTIPIVTANKIFISSHDRNSSVSFAVMTEIVQNCQWFFSQIICYLCYVVRNWIRSFLRLRCCPCMEVKYFFWVTGVSYLY
jgi:hypothetical protein